MPGRASSVLAALFLLALAASGGDDGASKPPHPADLVPGAKTFRKYEADWAAVSRADWDAIVRHVYSDLADDQLSPLDGGPAGRLFEGRVRGSLMGKATEPKYTSALSVLVPDYVPDLESVQTPAPVPPAPKVLVEVKAITDASVGQVEGNHKQALAYINYLKANAPKGVLVYVTTSNVVLADADEKGSPGPVAGPAREAGVALWQAVGEVKADFDARGVWTFQFRVGKARPAFPLDKDKPEPNPVAAPTPAVPIRKPPQVPPAAGGRP